MIVTAIITILFLTYVAQLAVVCGESMADTLHDTNIVLVEKITKRTKRGYQRYDVVVFETENPQKPYYIKRVMGVPGERIYIQDSNIFVNDFQIQDPYKREPFFDRGDRTSEFTLPENNFFVMGDNRNNSLDGRYKEIGDVDESIIVGRVLFGLMPIKKVY